MDEPAPGTHRETPDAVEDRCAVLFRASHSWWPIPNRPPHRSRSGSRLIERQRRQSWRRRSRQLRATAWTAVRTSRSGAPARSHSPRGTSVLLLGQCHISQARNLGAPAFLSLEESALCPPLSKICRHISAGRQQARSRIEPPIVHPPHLNGRPPAPPGSDENQAAFCTNQVRKSALTPSQLKPIEIGYLFSVAYGSLAIRIPPSHHQVAVPAASRFLAFT